MSKPPPPKKKKSHRKKEKKKRPVKTGGFSSLDLSNLAKATIWPESCGILRNDICAIGILKTTELLEATLRNTRALHSVNLTSLFLKNGGWETAYLSFGAKAPNFQGLYIYIYMLVLRVYLEIRKTQWLGW